MDSNLSTLLEDFPDYDRLLSKTAEVLDISKFPPTFHKLLESLMVQCGMDIICKRIAYSADGNMFNDVSVAQIPFGVAYDKISSLDKGILFSLTFLKCVFPMLKEPQNNVIPSKTYTILLWWRRILTAIYQNCQETLLSPVGMERIKLSAEGLVKELDTLIALNPTVAPVFKELDDLLDTKAGAATFDKALAQLSKAHGQAVNVYYYALKAKKFLAHLKNSETELAILGPTITVKPKAKSASDAQGTFLDLSD